MEDLIDYEAFAAGKLPENVHKAIFARAEALKQWLIKIILAPNVGLRNGRLVGVLLVVRKDCPAKFLIGDHESILEGISSYAIRGTPSGDALCELKQQLAEGILEDAGAREFDLNNPTTEWDPSLGRAPHKNIQVGYIRKNGSDAWTLFVHANPEHAARQFLQRIRDDRGMTAETMAESAEYKTLVGAGSQTRNRLALLAADILKVQIAQTKTPFGKIEYMGGVPSSETFFNVVKRLKSTGHQHKEPIYGFYVETTSTMDVGAGGLLMHRGGHLDGYVTVMGGPADALVGKPWGNARYNLFPVNTGLDFNFDPRTSKFGRLTGKRALDAQRRVAWAATQHKFNYALHEPYRPYDKPFRKLLRGLGHQKEWKANKWEMILSHVPSPDESIMDPEDFVRMTSESEEEIKVPLNNRIIAMIATVYGQNPQAFLGRKLSVLFGHEDGRYMSLSRQTIQTVLELYAAAHPRP